MNKKIPIEERVWAVIAHLSAIAMGMGILLPVIGWSESRRKSNYTAFHSLQALGYQTLGYTIWILVTLVFIVIVSINSFAGMADLVYSEKLENEIMALVFAHTTLMFVLIGVYFLLPILGAVSCAFGKDFRYPILGSRLAKYLGYEFPLSVEEETWLIEEHEDRWVASMGHFAVIIMLWGMLVPATAWIVQSKRSLFLKLQAIQAFVFQAGTLLLYVLSMVIYFGGAIIFFLSVGGMDGSNLDSSAGIMGLVVLLVSLICVFGIVLLIPLFHIMGQWAGYRILKGDDYRYPVIGKWIAKRVLK